MLSAAGCLARASGARLRNFFGTPPARTLVRDSINRNSAKPKPGQSFFHRSPFLLPIRFITNQTQRLLDKARSRMPPEWFDFLVKVVVPVFGIQWVGWIVACIFKTEKFYDLTGSATYLYVAIIMGLSRWNVNRPAQNIQAILVSLWAIRLGSFLFYRVMQSGRDTRFNEIKQNIGRFFVAWTLQGVWVTVTMMPSLLMWIGSYNPPRHIATRQFGPREGIGFAIWLFGFLFEVIGDAQKTRFKADPSNEGKFIQSGLWKYSRHPNYFGEIVLWFGLFISATPYFKNPFMYFSILAPIFDFLLITKISGIPMLEAAAHKKWGKTEEYQQYLLQTPALVPCVPWADRFCVPKPKVDDTPPLENKDSSPVSNIAN